MKLFLKITLALLLFIAENHCIKGQEVEKIRGLTMVAPPDSFSTNPMLDIEKANADWVALVPYGFSRLEKTFLRYDMDQQWWGEKSDGVKTCIRLAHSQGIKVMLKPQIYVPGSWIGYLKYDTEEDWQKWEAEYEKFIMTFVEIAVAQNVEMICIGTEIRESVSQRPEFWKTLIKDIKTIYDGKLCYSANWDSYEQISFWKDLDYIGISSYFPLSEEKTPSVSLLRKLWKPTVKKLKKYVQKIGKPLLFTEYGYLSVDRAADKTWELEKIVKQSPINEQAQANALEALYSSFWNEKFWAGGFLWKWFPEMMGHEGYPERDYTPQGKISEQTVQLWYAKP